METLRLYPPILALPKWSSQYPQKLKISDRTIVIPPRTGVMPSLLTVQTHPENWDSPLEWQPKRWLRSLDLVSAVPKSGSGAAAQEELITPAKGTYFPWSDGPQNCPGAKFAQVEFVAVLASVFKNHRVRVLRDEGESFESARKRILSTTEDCDMKLLLRMRDASKIRLACEER